MLIALVAGSVTAGVIATYLYVKKGQFALAFALPILTTTLVVGAMVNALVLGREPLDGMTYPAITAGVLFVLAFVASGIITPIVTWILLSSIVAMPFATGETISNPVLYGSLAAGLVLTWLLLPALKTLVISLLVALNFGFAASLLALPDAELVFRVAPAVSAVSLVGVVILAREQWGRTWLLLKDRFKKNGADRSADGGEAQD